MKVEPSMYDNHIIYLVFSNLHNTPELKMACTYIKPVLKYLKEIDIISRPFYYVLIVNNGVEGGVVLDEKSLAYLEELKENENES